MPLSSARRGAKLFPPAGRMAETAGERPSRMDGQASQPESSVGERLKAGAQGMTVQLAAAATRVLATGTAGAIGMTGFAGAANTLHAVFEMAATHQASVAPASQLLAHSERITEVWEALVEQPSSIPVPLGGGTQAPLPAGRVSPSRVPASSMASAELELQSLSAQTAQASALRDTKTLRALLPKLLRLNERMQAEVERATTQREERAKKPPSRLAFLAREGERETKGELATPPLNESWLDGRRLSPSLMHSTALASLQEATQTILGVESAEYRAAWQQVSLVEPLAMCAHAVSWAAADFHAKLKAAELAAPPSPAALLALEQSAARMDLAWSRLVEPGLRGAVAAVLTDEVSAASVLGDTRPLAEWVATSARDGRLGPGVRTLGETRAGLARALYAASVPVQAEAQARLRELERELQERV